MILMRPYLTRAIYDWIIDNEWTPHLIVDAEVENVVIPREFVKEGKIVLNILPSAVKNLELGDDWINFEARFSGRPFKISIPIQAVLALYARENGRGMTFPLEEIPQESPPEPPPSRPSKPMLKRIK
jgi:stringent starvation protein B